VIAFRLQERSGVAPYLQLARQVRDAVRYGLLKPGDQLPTIREVVAKLAINPNTVLKAYRELEREHLIRSRPGQGTFISDHIPAPLARSVHAPLRRSLLRWLKAARRAGLDRESIEALIALTLREEYAVEVA
jgi:GntR family transcriptional regulator